MLTCIDAALRASEPLAVDELRPCALEGGTRPLLVQLERNAEMLIQVVVSSEKTMQAGDGGECPASIQRAGELGELRELAHRGLPLAGSRVGPDEIGRIRQETRPPHAPAPGPGPDPDQLF